MQVPGLPLREIDQPVRQKDKRPAYQRNGKMNKFFVSFIATACMAGPVLAGSDNPCSKDMKETRESAGAPAIIKRTSGSKAERMEVWEYPDIGWKKTFKWGDLYEKNCFVESDTMPLSEKAIGQKVKELKKAHPAWSDKTCRAVLKRKVFVGMTGEQVAASWGEPHYVRKTGSESVQDEVWEYPNGSLLFTGGKVTSISTAPKNESGKTQQKEDNRRSSKPKP